MCYYQKWNSWWKEYKWKILSYLNSAEVVHHTCDENGNNLPNAEEEADITWIHYIKATTDISMNEDEHFIHKYYAPFVLSKNHEDVFSGLVYDSAQWTVCHHKTLFLIY